MYDSSNAETNLFPRDVFFFCVKENAKYFPTFPEALWKTDLISQVTAIPHKEHVFYKDNLKRAVLALISSQGISKYRTFSAITSVRETRVIVTTAKFGLK